VVARHAWYDAQAYLSIGRVPLSEDIRPIEPGELEAFTAAMGTAFGFDATPKILEQWRGVGELDRSLAVFDGAEIVGTAGIFSYRLTVPGAVLPMAGVTWVSVKPTHRRQGALTKMMHRQLFDIHEREEPLAGLWASESIIYDRYGYGTAAEGVELRIERTRTALARRGSPRGRTRLVSREEALESWPAVYDRVLATQPGMFSRSESWWKYHTLRESAGQPGRSSGSFYVQYDEDGRALGYARYRIRQDQQAGSPNGTLLVLELMPSTDTAYAALWNYLFGVDLIGMIEAYQRPVDEPLLWMLADPRRLQRRPWDSLWVRLVDVAPALEGRRYAASGRLVFEVQDEFCPWNGGRYELEAGPDGARCRRSDAEPDVVLDAADLGSVYLGGVRFLTLRRAGRLQGEAKALKQADAMFAWDPLPWCPEVF
jgi:predicted acetyltransferase